MANIKLNLPCTPFTGQIVTFKALCASSEITDGLIINDEIYTVCDALGNCVTGVTGIWEKNANVSVILDCTEKEAFIQNPAIPVAVKPTYNTATMTASGWSGNTYSFEADYPKNTYDISIEVAPTATAEQFEAFGGAMICGSVDSNVATALGDVPTVDIPVIVKAVRK